MKVGDKVLLAGREWTVRAFTAAEHQKFDELAAEADLTRLAAKAETHRAARHGTARTALLKSQAANVQKKLDKYLTKDGGLKPTLSEDDVMEAMRLGGQLDAITAEAEALKDEPLEDAAIAADTYLAARDLVMVRFMHEVLKDDRPLDEFHASLSDVDFQTLDEVVAVGKLRAGLSARARRARASVTQMTELIASREHGNALESRQQQPSQADSQRKRGTSGRSRGSSSKLKAGNSAASK